MGEQIKHEAEVSRQHARYRIPAKIKVDDYIFSLREWSVSGFSTDHISADIGENACQEGNLIFETGDFTLSVPIEFEVRHYDRESGFMRARFVNMNRRNLALLHYIINAYLAGEVVAAGDILEVAGRDTYVKKETDAESATEESRFRKSIRAAKRAAGYALMLIVLAGLLWFIGYTIYNRMFVVDAISARVTGDIVVLRAPDNGIFEIPEAQKTAELKRGDLMGIVKLTGGGAASIVKPCECRVIDVHGVEDTFVGQGEPLFTLLPSTSRLNVTAWVAFEDVRKLKVGQSARIRLVDGSELAGSISAIRAAAGSEVPGPAPGGAGGSSGDRVANVRIVTERLVPPDMLDTVASVSFNTLRDGAG